MPANSIDHAFTATKNTGRSGDPTYAGALSFMRRRYTKNVEGRRRRSSGAFPSTPPSPTGRARASARRRSAAPRRSSTATRNIRSISTCSTNSAVVDYGDCLLDNGNHQKTPATIEREAAKILKSGAFLLTLGGDHFVTWPLLKAHAAMHGPLALVQFDAHQDTWDDDGKRIDHGSFVARAVREGIIDPDRSIQIGIRTHAPDDFGIKILYGYDVEEMRASDIAYAIAERTGGKKTYVTFDIDCLDPAFAPGTGTPVAGGPSSAKMLSVLRQMTQIDIVGADVVEVAPAYDHADITAIAGATVAMHYLGLLAERKARESA